MASHKNAPHQRVLSENRRHLEPAEGHLGPAYFKWGQSRGSNERQMRPALGSNTQGRASAEREGHRECSVHPTLSSPSQNTKINAGLSSWAHSPLHTHLTTLCVCLCAGVFTRASTNRSLLLLVIYRDHQKPRPPTQPLANQSPSL